MTKPNRVHKATGLRAEPAENYNGLYTLFCKTGSVLIPAEIVEGEGWEYEKSEIQKAMLNIHRLYTGEEDMNVRIEVELRNMLIEFAKNYKEQGK